MFIAPILTGAVAPTFIGHTAFADANTSSATPDFGPDGLVNDTILLVWCHLAAASSGVYAQPPSGEGWNRIADVEDGTGVNSNLSAFWKRVGMAGQTDNSTPTFTNSGGFAMSAVGQIWRGCFRAATPIDAFSTAHGNATTSLVGASASSTGFRRSVASVYGACATSVQISGISGSGFTQDFVGSSFATTSGADRCMGGAYNNSVGSGATSATTATATVNATWTNIVVVLKPA